MGILEKRLYKLLLYSGLSLILCSLLLLSAIYFPIVKGEVTYELYKNDQKPDVLTKDESKNTDIKKFILPQDESFGIVIPQINANASIQENVDPFNTEEYSNALKKGVAHAKDTAFPGHNGKIFLFAHSSTNLYIAIHYNAVFYLLDKLKPGDSIYLFYKGERFLYMMNNKKIINASETNYITDTTDHEQLVLMTCWPPGSSTKRLLLFADKVIQ